MPILAILIGALLIAVVGAAVYFLRSGGGASTQAPDGPSVFASRPLPKVEQFHVKGDTATVQFSVPLGDAGASAHLTELLSAAAVEHIRALVRDGLPLEDVTRITVSAMRSGSPETVTTFELPSAGVLPETNVAVLSEAGSDPIAALQAIVADSEVSSSSGGSTGLESVAEFVSLSNETESHLRSIGVNPVEMSLSDLVLGLLRSGGYLVQPSASKLSSSLEGTAEVYDVTNKGRRSLLAILAHEPGSHPELDDAVLALIAVEVAQSNPFQAILVTDKYSPYSMYEREKRDKRSVFVTRERLQAFVDSFDAM